MNNVIHMCFSASASGSFKYAIKENIIKGKKVISFYDNLSEGKIGNLKNLDDRIEWYKSISHTKEISKEDIYEYKRDYHRYRRKIAKLTREDVIYMWYGECSEDICGMMYALELMKDKCFNIYLINVSSLVEENEYEAFIPKSVSEVMSKDINKYIKFKKELNKNTYKDILQMWEALKNQNEVLRIFKDGKVKSSYKEYFDIDILKNTNKKFRKAARIVGYVLGYSDQNISDDYIFWRVQELIKQGYIEYKGKFGVMREMEIKITNKGIEMLSNDKEAIAFWKEREEETDNEIEYRRIFREECALKERVNIARNLLDVLEAEVIAEKTGLTIEQVKNLEMVMSK